MSAKKPWREIDPKDFEPVIDDGPFHPSAERAVAGTVDTGPDRPERPTCYNKAIDLLSRRPHFSTELRTKLKKRDYADHEIEETLERLVDRRFLDDRETARIFVESKLRRGGAGRRKLLADLMKRGITGELADEAVAILGFEEELESGREAARRYNSRAARGGKRTGDSRQDQQALSRHLDRKGFSKRVILAILGETP